MRPSLVSDFLENNAKNYPERIALVADGKAYSYAQLNNWANQAAHVFQITGLKRGGRVVICLENSVEQLISMFGTIKADGVFASLHQDSFPPNLVYSLQQLEPDVVVAQGFGITASHFSQAYKQAEINCPLFWVTKETIALPDNMRTENGRDFWQAILEAKGSPLPRITIDSDLCTIISTSGTTGKPKGVMLAHKHIIAAATSIADYLENDENDVILCVLSLAFSYGLYQMLVTFMTGAKLVLERSFAFPAKTLELFQSEQVTGFAGVATTFSRLLIIPDIAGLELPNLRYLTCAGGPLVPAQYARLREAFPIVKIFPMYGMTECTRIAYSPPEIAEYNPAALGKTVLNLEAWVADDNGKPVPTGTIGELVVRSPFIAYGYWRNAEATAEKFKPGQFFNDQILFTGDLFRQDEQGYLYFVARQDEILKSGGEKVAPIEVENVLLQMPEVHEVCVVGVPDEDLGEAVCAVLVLKAGASLTEKQINQHCRKARLEQIKIPKYIKFVAELPKSDNGKILRRKVKSNV